MEALRNHQLEDSKSDYITPFIAQQTFHILQLIILPVLQRSCVLFTTGAHFGDK
jgi:hypothetical protein